MNFTSDNGLNPEVMTSASFLNNRKKIIIGLVILILLILAVIGYLLFSNQNITYKTKILAIQSTPDVLVLETDAKKSLPKIEITNNTPIYQIKDGQTTPAKKNIIRLGEKVQISLSYNLFSKKWIVKKLILSKS